MQWQNEMSTHFYNTYSLQITIYKTHNIYELWFNFIYFYFLFSFSELFVADRNIADS